MQVQELQTIEHLHHAYIVTGGARGQEEIVRILHDRGVSTRGNPDVLSLSFSELLVDDVRDRILSFAALKPLQDQKYAVLSFSRANDASQNALLKAVEESLGRTVFFLCVESAGHLLPTLRSRCIAVTSSHKEKSDETSEEAEAFLKAAYAKRLASVDAMTGYIAKTQDRAPVRAFARELLRAARLHKLPARSLRDILDASGYLRMQGSSPKAVLSHLAVSLPRAVFKK